MAQQPINKRSLSEEQIKDCFNKFKSLSKILQLAKSPQIKKKTESEHISFIFVKKSNGYSVSTPRISIHTKQYCKNLENVKTVEIIVHDCSECRGSDSAEITSRKYTSFEIILADAFKIWHNAYKENLVKDKKLVDDQKNLKKLEKLFSVGSKKYKNEYGSNSTKYLIGKRDGHISTDDDHESRFKISLENISYTDMTRLTKFLNQFLKENS